MSVYKEILLPNDASYYCDAVNTSYEIASAPLTWTIEYKITDNLAGSEVGISTFISDTSRGSLTLPGHYIGRDMPYTNIPQLSSGELWTYTDYDTTYSPNLLHIAFDTTGLFALDATTNIKPNSLIIYNRDTLIYNEFLSDIAPDFDIISNEFQTLKFTLDVIQSNLDIEYKALSADDFIPLVSIDIDDKWAPITRGHPGVSYSSPISSSDINKRARFNFKSLNVFGIEDDIEIDIIPLSAIGDYHYDGHETITNVIVTPKPI